MVKRVRDVIVSIAGGILFLLMDVIINANPLAQNLNEFYEPIARTSVNATAGAMIDITSGFIMAGVFLLLYRSLPGETGLIKGMSFAFLVWFFRVAMSAASSWMMFNIPACTLIYALITGLLEMLALGVLYGAALKPEGEI